MDLHHNQSGLIALIAVVVITAVVLAIALTVGLTSLGELSLGFWTSQSKESLYLAEGCLEEVILRLNRDSDYDTDNLSFDSRSCSINIVANGNDRTIEVAADPTPINNKVRKMRAEVELTPQGVIVNSWREIP